MLMKLKFCGAAKCVTGSCHMVSSKGGTLLIDCGMRQGADAKTAFGEGEFPFSPADIDAVILTHAHIDHTGLIPLLVKRGFKGRIISTSATAKLSGIMLPDSGHIQEQEAEYQNRKNQRAGRPLVEPLYTVKDAMAALAQYAPVEYEQTVTVFEGVKARLTDVGHLLGSAAVELWIEEDGKTAKLVFSGDLGRDDRPIICDPESIDSADYLVLEGTYGDRNHDASTEDAKMLQLANVLKAAMRRGGNVVIPSFAVGRTQELLYNINRMLRNGTVPGLERIPVYIDSPLGIEATKIYQGCAEGYYDEEARKMAESGSPFEFASLRVARTADESKLINVDPAQKIIISSSGMCDAGRIRHHLKHNLYRADSTIVFVGYQAEGTLGRILLDGVKKVKLFGEEVRVNATIERIDGFSGHAGRDELIRWVTDIPKKPERLFLVHGERSSLKSLGDALKSLDYYVEVPDMLEEFELIVNEKRRATVPEVTAVLESGSLIADKRVSELQSQTERIVELLESLNNKQTPDSALMLKLMQKDIETMVRKWEELIG